MMGVMPGWDKKLVKVTPENYFSTEASMDYMGASQFKAFMDCPARAMAEIRGEYKMTSDALLQGSYMDAHFEGTLDIFKGQHPELFKRDGSLLAKYEHVNDCINAIESDPVMLKLCTGEQQKIMTGMIGDVPFKIMIDSYHPDVTVDRKLMANFDDKWKDGEYVPWWKAYGYQYQAAIYSYIRAQNEHTKMKPFDLVAVSKEPVPDKDWVRFDPDYLHEVLAEIYHHASTFKSIKVGFLDAEACGDCEYCRMHKKLTVPRIIGGEGDGRQENQG